MNGSDDHKIRFLNCLWKTLYEDGIVQIVQYIENVESYIQSPESRDGSFGEKIGSFQQSVLRALDQTYEEFSSDSEWNKEKDTVENYLKAEGRKRPWEIQYYLYDVKNALRLSPVERDQLDKKAYSRMYEISILNTTVYDALHKYWKPAIKVSDVGHDVTYYDPELQFFFYLSPDDNYYHFNSYDYYPCYSNPENVFVDSDLVDPAVAASFVVRDEIPDRYRHAVDYKQLPEIYARA